MIVPKIALLFIVLSLHKLKNVKKKLKKSLFQSHKIKDLNILNDGMNTSIMHIAKLCIAFVM